MYVYVCACDIFNAELYWLINCARLIIILYVPKQWLKKVLSLSKPLLIIYQIKFKTLRIVQDIDYSEITWVHYDLINKRMLRNVDKGKILIILNYLLLSIFKNIIFCMFEKI